MREHLCLSHDEYRAVVEALRDLAAAGDHRAFRRGLATALRKGHPKLAERIGQLNDAQTRALRETVEWGGKGAPDQLVLSFADWQVLTQLAALARLRGDRLTYPSLVALVAAESASLAEKLAALSSARLARLLFALHSGRRFCNV
jgi:hypothetical protein